MTLDAEVIERRCTSKPFGVPVAEISQHFLPGGKMQAHPFDVVAIGASAGGIEALSKLLHALPADLPAAVLVTLHRPVERESQLHHILAQVSKLPVVVARHGEQLRPGKCYLGSPTVI